MTHETDLLHFAPVPSQRRARGWTDDAQHAFIQVLSRCGVVAQAARSVGCSPRSAYYLRRRSGAESFAAAWDWAIEFSMDEQRSRAFALIDCREERIMTRHGRVVGKHYAPNYRVMLAALKARTAECMGGDRMPHRIRIAERDIIARTDLSPPDNPVDWGAVDLPWFDRSCIGQGADAVDAACRAARMEERRRSEEAANAPPPPPSPTPPARPSGPSITVL